MIHVQAPGPLSLCPAPLPLPGRSCLLSDPGDTSKELGRGLRAGWAGTLRAEEEAVVAGSPAPASCQDLDQDPETIRSYFTPKSCVAGLSQG